jgi:hypothetical protein
MRGVHWLPLVGLVLACGGQAEPLEDMEVDSDSSRTLLTVEELPPMPAYPEARRGRLVTVSAGDFELGGVWEVEAGLCEEIGIIEIYAGPPGFRTALVLRIPEGDPRGRYPVEAPGRDFPDAPGALLAVQVFDEPEAYGFQAFFGELELWVLGERISGRFTTTLREIGVDMFTHFVGVFEAVSIAPLPADYCQAMLDSTVAPDSATVADSAASGGS